jgi:Phage tail tube protein, TTP
MATQATAATGTIVKISTVTIPELRNATDIGMAFAMVDVSAHDGDGWSSNIPTLKRGKPITLELNYVPGNAAHQSLFTAAQTRASTPFTVTLPTTGNPTWSFNAFVGDIGIPAVPVDGALPLRVVLTPDGQMTFA